MTEQMIPADQASTTGEQPKDLAKPGVAAFKFPFAPANFAPKQAPTQPWHQKGSNARHEKKIGMAPNGTRRSMGKR